MNFSRALADFRAVEVEERRKRRFTDAMAVAMNDLVYDLRRGTEQQRAAAEDQILDYFMGSGAGTKAFSALLLAVIEEEPKQALAALEAAIASVARWQVESR